MKKKWCFLIFILANSLLCTANPIDVSKARQVALQFIETRCQSDSALKSRTRMNPKLELAFIQNGEAGNVFYVFNQQDQGFVIVSADDETSPILGYADKGSFDANNLPEGLKDILKSYEKQISYAVRNNVGKSRAPHNWSDIAPMIQTRWDQYEPYNNLCPIDPDTGERSKTGCVAVAKAQLLYYHQFPKTGRGTISYEWKGQTLSADFSQTNFEWDKMKLTYNHDTPDTDNAVANLMWYCAVESKANFGSELTYGFYNTDDFPTYFGFKEGVYWLSRDNISEDEFEEIIYQDLAKGLPVFYCAEDPNLWSHVFLIDGYESGGYFHMNFGWSGDNDGYYLLSAINLDWINFSTGHNIMYNIQPDIPGKWFLQTDDGRFFEMSSVGSIEADPNSETDLLLLDQSGNIIASGFTEATFIQTGGISPLSISKGDANSDGDISSKDVVAIVNSPFGKTVVGYNKIGADINVDGMVNIADILCLVNILMTK